MVAELLLGSLRDFYRDRPLQAGILTGLLLAGVAAFGVDAVRANLHERKWEPLSRLALIALGYSTTLLVDTFLWLVTGQLPTNDAAPYVNAQERLLAVRRQAGLPDPPDPPDLGAVRYEAYAAALTQLAADAEWRSLAQAALDRAKWRNRDGIAIWSASMLATGSPPTCSTALPA
jgi:hypothetical protein